MKQAINGNLTYDNTDNIIVGDWGITQDGGLCANVQTTIDTLIGNLNDTIAPTSADFNIAADRLYFNRNYLAEEATGLTTTEFTYTLNGINYQAFQYTDVATRQTELKNIILGVISDLQTGGTNSTIRAIEAFINTSGNIQTIDDKLLPTIYAIERIRFLGQKHLTICYMVLMILWLEINIERYMLLLLLIEILKLLQILIKVIYRFRDLIDIAS